MSAMDVVPDGRLNQVNGGEKFKPLQVNLAGMDSPSVKADETMLMFAILPTDQPAHCWWYFPGCFYFPFNCIFVIVAFS